MIYLRCLLLTSYYTPSPIGCNCYPFVWSLQQLESHAEYAIGIIVADDFESPDF